MGEIRMSAWGASTPQQKYDNFKQGYRYRTDYNVMTYSGNTTYPNMPEGFIDTRPAGSGSYTYTGYGISTGSLDEAWDLWIVRNGGQTNTMQADIVRLAAEDAARIAAEQAAIQANEIQQLALKSQMLQSDTATWANQATYEQKLAETNLAITAMNETLKADTKPPIQGNTELGFYKLPWNLIIIAIVAAVLLFFIFSTG